MFTMCLSLVPALLGSASAADDLVLPALSPRAGVMQQVGPAELRVDYASPGKRDRTVWGEVVPWGELWRTGANRATTLTTTHPVSFGGTAVPAGTYALFTIPGETRWTVILNGNADQNGTGRYDAALDVARIEVEPARIEGRERLTFVFSDTTEASTRLDLEWDGLRVGIPIDVDTRALVSADVARFTTHAAGQLTQAARYHARIEAWDEALRLVDRSIALEETWYNAFVRAEILKGRGDGRAAYKQAKHAQKLGEGAENVFWKDRIDQAVKEWRRG